MPTAIELAAFYATTTSAAKCGNPSGADCVNIFWQTTREVNTVGFVIFRTDASDQYMGTPMMTNLIESQGMSGASYSWRDTSAQPGASYAYWLREVNENGEIQEFGPVYVSVDGTMR